MGGAKRAWAVRSDLHLLPAPPVHQQSIQSLGQRAAAGNREEGADRRPAVHQVSGYCTPGCLHGAEMGDAGMLSNFLLRKGEQQALDQLGGTVSSKQLIIPWGACSVPSK